MKKLRSQRFELEPDYKGILTAWLLACRRLPTFVVLDILCDLSRLLSLLAAAVVVSAPWKARLIIPFFVALVLDGFLE